MKAGFMSKVFYLFPILAFAVFTLMAINLNSNLALKYNDKKDHDIKHVLVRKNIDTSNF
jgi:hypothetical protein